MPDFNNLPLILSGPIVRRVDPTLVAVWVALSAARMVEPGIWTGITNAGSSGVFFGNTSASHRATAASIRIGAKLHLALVTLDLTASPLIPGQIYVCASCNTSDHQPATHTCSETLLLFIISFVERIKCNRIF
ncbi:MAG: hypothetical protein RMJ55_10145 [Roseiflexaceae bacterium]|nr:hypothetical protein [Roseiflexus sp.]MDW8213909.1 hypothetical protein [Roseiflexaceae bacterium]